VPRNVVVSSLLAVVVLLFARTAAAEKVLLPILTEDAPGAGGSLWETEVRLLLSAEPTDLFPLVDCAACSIPTGSVFAPPLFFQRPAHPPGAVVYIETNPAGRFHWSLRVRERSRAALDRGTEVPVVRERDLFTSTLHLVDVPVESGYRQTLRVYDVDARPNAAVRITFSRQDGTLIGTLDRALQLSPVHNPNFARNVTPGYLQLDRWHALLPGLEGVDRVWIRVDPLTAGLRFWAFASLTSDATQQFTVVSPQ
jgi:hypothetical protein